MGPTTTCYNRYNRWSRIGNRSAILVRHQGVVDGDDDPHGDSPEPGRSQGGLSTEIHAVVDRNGQPNALCLSPGQSADRAAAETLLTETEAGITVISNKACGTNAIPRRLAKVGASAIIPARKNRTDPRMLYHALHAARSLVERFGSSVESRNSGESPADMTSENQFSCPLRFARQRAM